ncbi:hypothetical protein Tco_0006659 [Tanacetum coccineum]
MMTEAMSLVMSRRMVVSIQRTSSMKSCSSSRASRMFIEQSHDKACGYLIALGWNLEEIHMTWTQFGKKQTRIQLYTKLDIKRAYRPWRRRHNSLRRRQKAQATTSGTLATASEVASLKEALEDSAG